MHGKFLLSVHSVTKLTVPLRVRAHALKAIKLLLTHCSGFQNTMVIDRLMRSAVTSLTSVLATRSDISANMSADSRSRKTGKKRARDFEAEEVFKPSVQKVLESKADFEAALVACDGE